MNALTRRARLKRFATTAGTIWGLWVPVLTIPPTRGFVDAHPWMAVVALAQGPAVATVTLLVGEWGRSRTDAVDSGPTVSDA